MSLVAFSARNHPQQKTLDTVDDRGTPRDFFAVEHSRHRFTIDVAASESNALMSRFFTRDRDGLAASWEDERVWCNPPYSNIRAWVEKAHSEVRGGHCPLVVMLLPANRCEQDWWQNFIEPYRDAGPINGVELSTRFLRGRMRFVMPEGYQWGPSRKKGDRPPFGCVLVCWEIVSAIEPSLSSSEASE